MQTELSIFKTTIHFNLKQVRDRHLLTQIILVVNANRQRFRIYTKLRVQPLYWDRENECCSYDYAMNQRIRNELKQINDSLTNIRKMVYRTDKHLAAKGEYLSKMKLQEIIQSNHSQKILKISPLRYLKELLTNYDHSMNRKGAKGMSSSKITYQTAYNRLVAFCKEESFDAGSLENFDKFFFQKFTDYLYNYTYVKGGKPNKYTQNTIVNTLKVMKNLLHKAYDNDMLHNDDFTKVQTTLSAKVSEKIYLKENEIMKLAQVLTTSQHEKEVRDLFIIACYTALRISDLQQLNEAIIKDGTIALYQTKTKDYVNIPILKEIAALIASYQQTGFPKLSPNKANQTIRCLAERCKIDDEIMYKEFRGGKVTIKTKKKYELITFHTARRSCITNLYKRGYPVNYIMTLSGHHSMQAFERYLKASNDEMMHMFMHLLKRNHAV